MGRLNPLENPEYTTILKQIINGKHTNNSIRSVLNKNQPEQITRHNMAMKLKYLTSQQIVMKPTRNNYCINWEGWTNQFLDHLLSNIADHSETEKIIFIISKLFKSFIEFQLNREDVVHPTIEVLQNDFLSLIENDAYNWLDKRIDWEALDINHIELDGDYAYLKVYSALTEDRVFSLNGIAHVNVVTQEQELSAQKQAQKIVFENKITTIEGANKALVKLAKENPELLKRAILGL